jgi:hypothetical protein
VASIPHFRPAPPTITLKAAIIGISNSQMRQKATDLGQKIQAENGIENALTILKKCCTTMRC